MSSAFNKKRVAFSVINCICYDQRVLKMAATVQSLGCDITIIGRERGECCNSGQVPFKTVRFRMFFRKGFLFYKFFNIRLFFFLLFHRYDVLVANDLDTLLPNYLVSKLRGLPLVYDSHEYFTGVPELKNRNFVKWVWKNIEKAIFPRLKYVITVSEAIAALYHKEYFLKPVVIRNLSPKSDSIVPYSKRESGIEDDELTLILQGTGINIDKGAEELIQAISITSGVSLLVVGSGDIIPLLKRMVNELKIGTRVIFIPSVNWETLMKYTKSADIGICLEKDTCLNYRFCLPNKLFDYISAGIPVIASNLPETRNIISEFKCGLIIDRVDPVSISKALTDLKNDKVRLAGMMKNAKEASCALNWDAEREKVLSIYNEVIG
jgi:glycosyltransferase involved in cell wall biosynthesis